jgi:hypothetical protein
LLPMLSKATGKDLFTRVDLELQSQSLLFKLQ